MKRHALLLGPLAVLCVAGLLHGRQPPPAGKQPGKVQYARDIQPILATHCFTCHGPDEKTRKAGLRLDQSAAATKELRSGNRAIVPGKSGDSELIARVNATDDDERM